MKKIRLLLFCSLFATACDRLSHVQSSHLTIQLPAVKSQNVTVSATTTVSAEPTGLTGTRPINCYVVGVGGPEDALSRNVCQRTDGTATFQPRRLGLWTGAVPAGGTISLDVPSGKDRVVFVFGFYAANISDCRDFKTYGFPNGTLSDPYLIGEVGQQEFIADDTKDVPVPISFDLNNRFDKCFGPDFPADTKTIPTQLAISKDYFPYATTIESVCQSASVRLTDDRGREGSVSVPTNVQINFEGSPLQFYSSMTDCSSYQNAIPTLTIPAGNSQGEFFFKAPYTVSYTSYTLTAKAAPFIDGAKTFTNVTSSAKAIELAGPNRILPDMCYPYMLNLRQVNGTPSPESGGFALTYDDASGFKFFSDSACTTPAASPLNLPSTQSQLSVWGKLSTVNVIDLNLGASGYTPSHPFVAAGGGTTAVASVEVRGDNTGPQYGVVYSKPYFAQLFNDKNTAVITTVPYQVYFLDPGLNFDYGLIPSFSTGVSSFVIPAGAHAGEFYIKPKGLGSYPIGVSGNGTPPPYPYLINVSP